MASSSKINAQPHFHWLALALIIGIAVVARVRYLNVPLTIDESRTMMVYSTYSPFRLVTRIGAADNHLLHTILAEIAIHLFGMKLWAMRLPAFIGGIGVMLSAYVLFRRLYGNMTALLTVALIAASPMLILYSVTARGYSILATLFLISLWIVHSIIEGVGQKGTGVGESQGGSGGDEQMTLTDPVSAAEDPPLHARFSSVAMASFLTPSIRVLLRKPGRVTAMGSLDIEETGLSPNPPLRSTLSHKPDGNLLLLLGVSLLTALSLYTTLSALYFVGVPYVWLVISLYTKHQRIERAMLRDVAISVGASVVLTLMLYAPVLIRYGVGNFLSIYTQAQVGRNLPAVMPWGLFAAQIIPFWKEFFDYGFVVGWGWVVAAILGMGMIIGLIVNRRMSNTTIPVVVSCFLGALPVVLMQRLLVEPRYWLPLYPILYGLAASGLVYVGWQLRRVVPAMRGNLRLALPVAVSAALGIAFVMQNPRYLPTAMQDDDFPEMREMQADLVKRLGPDDAVVLLGDVLPEVMEYHLNEADPQITNGVYDLVADTPDGLPDSVFVVVRSDMGQITERTSFEEAFALYGYIGKGSVVEASQFLDDTYFSGKVYRHSEMIGRYQNLTLFEISR